MNYRDSLDFELFIGSLLDKANIVNGNALTNFSIDLHELLEDIIQNYADDNNMDSDYDPSY